MSPINQAILSLGVLSLVAMGGYALTRGVPMYEPEQTSSERRSEVLADAAEAHCQFLLSRLGSELTAEAHLERAACLSD